MTRFDCSLDMHDLIFLPLLAAASVAGSGAAVSVSAGGAWALLARAGKAGHSSPLGRTLVEKSGASW